MSALYTIACNDCGAVGNTSVSGVAGARRTNYPAGWRNPRKGVDRCPECVAKVKKTPSEAHPGYF